MMRLATLAAIASYAAASPLPAVEIDDMIQSALAKNVPTEIFIHLQNTCTDAAKAFKANLLETNGALPKKKLLRVQIHDHLVEFTAKEQKELLAMAKKEGLEARGFWATNTVYVSDATPAFIKKVKALGNVRKMNGNKEYSVIQNVEGATQDEKFQKLPELNDSHRRRTQIYEYGIVVTRSEEAQLMGFRGEGTVVCNVDTGVRWTHEALIGSYRGGVEDHDWNWVGPGSSGNPSEPTDGNGHGTHTMGTIAGQPVDIGIGMAPDSQWIAAAGCNPFGSCPTLDLTLSLEFCGCPTQTDGTNPDCTRAPDVCSNSWGGGQGSSAFWDVLGVLKEEEVVSVFSMGNSGSSCGSANSPGDSDLVISVGASDANDNVAFFSSRGPGVSIPGVTQQQPFIDGPGVSVISAYNAADDDYRSASGTSMSCPHVAGWIAQILAVAPDLTIAEIERVMSETAFKEMDPSPPACGGVPNDQYPNMVYGHGRIDVCAALSEVLGGNPCGGN
jgi:subtilisin family serine protease